ncbi:MAG TPA: hypothetical protein VF377_05275 [Acidimicrobiia bacterium]|jgi:hypothetical protein
MQPSPADTLTVEAGTAEQALEEITARLGPNAEIVDARKVQKGGIAGFFARELVQITARPRQAEQAPAPFERVLEAALAREAAEPALEGPAAEGLEPEMSAEVGPQPPGAPPRPAQTAPAEWRLSGGVDWSVTALARCDLPNPVIEAVMDLDPRDDLGWIAAIAGAVAPWCRPLPIGSSIFVGSSADRIGRSLELEVVTPAEMAPYGGDFAAPITASHREWLDTVRGERWLHLVVDEKASMDLLSDDVLAVSWVGSRGVAGALRLASSLGLVLGYGMGSGRGANAYRATPVDVALAIRELVGRR